MRERENTNERKELQIYILLNKEKVKLKYSKTIQFNDAVLYQYTSKFYNYSCKSGIWLHASYQVNK